MKNQVVESVSHLTLAQTLLELVYLDVLPLKKHYETITVMDSLLEFGFTGRELDLYNIHGKEKDEETNRNIGDLKTGSHRKYLESKFNEHSTYTTARGRTRSPRCKDYTSAVKMQLILHRFIEESV